MHYRERVDVSPTRPAAASGAVGPATAPQPADVDPGLDRDVFLRTLVRELAGTLQDTVGLEDAEGFVAVVGQRMGRWLDTSYREAIGVDRLDRDQVAEVLTDLKARIHGGFELVAGDEAVLEYTNDRCPFEDAVLGRPSMCMMTSNVFGSIAAENLGYAKVELGETIAQGSSRCHVLVHLDHARAEARPGREYFGG